MSNSFVGYLFWHVKEVFQSMLFSLHFYILYLLIDLFDFIFVFWIFNAMVSSYILCLYSLQFCVLKYLWECCVFLAI